MSTINFPSFPAHGQLYTFNTRTWFWNGVGWEVIVGLGGTGLFFKHVDIKNNYRFVRDSLLFFQHFP